MKKILIALIIGISFGAGFEFNKDLNSKLCLIQNVDLDMTLSIPHTNNCYITNVNFVGDAFK